VEKLSLGIKNCVKSNSPSFSRINSIHQLQVVLRKAEKSRHTSEKLHKKWLKSAIFSFLRFIPLAKEAFGGVASEPLKLPHGAASSN